MAAEHNDLVLITGVSGHVGFAVLREALKQGYNVRAVVRSEAKAKLVGENEALKGLKAPTNLSFAIIPDFLAPSAFSSALKDVTFVIHVASPQAANGTDSPDADNDAEIVQPAIRNTLTILETARSQPNPSVRRIVITSSSAAITPFSAFLEPSETVYSASTRLEEIPPPYPNRLVAYMASKTAALNRAEAWVKKEKPDFDVVHIHPSMVFGWDHLTTSKEDIQGGTNRFIVNHARGISDSQMPAFPNAYCSLDQVAYVHVKSLDVEHVPGNQSFIVSSNGNDGMEYNQIDEIVRKRFPREVEEGIFKSGAEAKTTKVRVDNKSTERVFAFVHKGWEEVVVETLEGWLEWKGGSKEIGV